MFARSGLPGFDYVRARTLDHAVELLEKHGEAARPLMGGTDLFPGMRDGHLRPTVVVDVKHLPGMREIRFAPREGLNIGAAVTMNQLARHPDVQMHYPILAQAAESVASYQVRNRATLGGNLCNASPCADTAPAALVLEAWVVLHGPDGMRTLAAGGFFRGPGLTLLKPGELLTGIFFPPPRTRSAGHYLKLGRSRSGDLALVGVAVLGIQKGASSDAHSASRPNFAFRIGLGSVAPTPLRAAEAEAFLAANPPGEESFAEAATRAMQVASPITDVRGSAGYQKAMVRVLTLRGLRKVWAQMKEAE